MSVTSSSVGSGVQSILGSPVSRLAREFYVNHGPIASHNAFLNFSKERDLTFEDSKALQDHLVRSFGMYKLAKTLKAESLSETEAHTGNRKVKKIRTESLGYAVDSDGRGKGPSGGSPMAGGSWGGITKKDSKRCPECGSPSITKAESGYVCSFCNSKFGSLGLEPEDVVMNAGAYGVKPNPVWGEISVPGGPISTTEGGYVIITNLGEDLFEIDVLGAKTIHNRHSMPEALSHRLSVFGRYAQPFLPKMENWFCKEGAVGMQLVFDMNGRSSFSMKDGQFLRHEKSY